MDQQTSILFCFKLWKSAKSLIKCMQQFAKNAVASEKDGVTKEDSPRSGRPATVLTHDNIRKVKDYFSHFEFRRNRASA